MKQRFGVIIVGFIVCISCGTNNSNQESSLKKNLAKEPQKQKIAYGIEINKDTFSLGIDGYLEKAVLFQDNFYCMFETARKNTSQSFKKMLVISKGGEFIENVFVPEEVQNMVYYDLKIENDSLFLKETQFEEQTFVLGKYVADFEITKKRNFKIYQDSTYNVFSTCYGEFGGSIFFQDKKTKEVFEAGSQCVIVVNKIAGQYYVTNYLGHEMGFTSILKIADPRKLQKLRFDFHKQFDLKTREDNYSRKGVEQLLDSMDFYIPASFVVDDQLLHLYSDDKGTYLGKIEKGKIVPIHSFGFTFYAQFDQQNTDGQQLLGFNIPDTNQKGILIIDENKLNFYFLK